MDKLWRLVQRLRVAAREDKFADEQQQQEEKGPKKLSVSARDLDDEDFDGTLSVSSTVNDQNSTNKPSAGHNDHLTATDQPKTRPAHTSQVAPLYDCLTPMTRSRLYTLAQIGEDWLYLALLGIIMALLSIFMDSIITMFLGTRIWLSEEISGQNLLLEYVAWCLVPILLVSFSTGFVHLCSPTAIGSGIPEMKTILRGVVLNEYLTFRTLVAKIVGLTFTLGSGLPLGKEGPSVHMASIVATLLSKLVASFQGIYENESRTSEMLSAACAVGVAATFYAPIGGVLFSIEVTTVYFAVRNYWRGFFAACCGATIWRLLGFYIQNDESISAIFKTNFQTEYPFDPVELLLFSFIGATCGLAAAAYIKFHREIVQFFRRHERISGFLQQNRFVYPTLVTLIITTSTFPPLMGKYTAATLSTHTTIEHLFSNRTWTLGSQDLASKQILDAWTTDSTGFHLHLVLYILMLFWTSALASTIPTPSGVFIPVVKMGAAYGRLVGELMAAAYPAGIQYSHPAMIVPGSYAVVGAAAFSGAVTHTVSTSVILFEMTGQIVHIIPVILGVLISNAVCQSLQPSIYDSIIEIKKLPYLPPIASSNSISHRILVKDFMNKKNIPFIWKERCTYADLKALLSSHRKIISFPLVESPDSMKLLGSVARPDLLKLLYLHLGRERRLQEVCRRNSDTLTPAIHLLNTISGGRHSTAATINEHDNDSDCQLKESDAINGKPATKVFTEFERPEGSVDTSPSTSSSDDIGGIEFISVRDLDRTHKQQQNKSIQLMGHVTVIPVANPNRQISTNVTQTNSNPLDCERPITMASLPRAATTTASASSITTVTTTGGTGESRVDDCDPTRLIISALTNCHKYGATSVELSGERQRPPPPLVPNTSGNQLAAGHNRQALRQSKSSPMPSTDSKPKLGEEQLLNDCQKRVNAYEEAEKEFGGVAKFINHYDRGSSMDKEHLEKSIQEVEGHLASVKDTPPEIVVVVETWLGDQNNTPSDPAHEPQQMTSVTSSKQPIKKLSLLKPPDEGLSKMQLRASFCRKTRPTRSQDEEQGGSGDGGDGRAGCDIQEEPRPKPRRLPELRVSPTASPNLYYHHRRNQPLSHSVSSSPSLSSRPFKSILKTSSCNNMAKRPISIAQSPNINKLNSSMKLKKPSSVLMQDLTSRARKTHLDQDNPNDGLSVISKQVKGATNQLGNLRFANLPDLQPHKGEDAIRLDLEAGFDAQMQQQQQIRQRRKVRLPRLRVVDMTPEEQEQWEKEQLSAFIELDKCQIDEAPFQLVEQTSLYRVHTLFSMLGLNHAYVTSFGRLVGIVALKDIRYAIEKMLQSKV